MEFGWAPPFVPHVGFTSDNGTYSVTVHFTR